jgi:hypothetical protein
MADLRRLASAGQSGFLALDTVNMCVGFEPPACFQPIDRIELGQFDLDQWGTELARAFDSELEESPDTGASLVGWQRIRIDLVHAVHRVAHGLGGNEVHRHIYPADYEHAFLGLNFSARNTRSGTLVGPGTWRKWRPL